MTASVIGSEGRTKWRGGRTQEGHREYWLTQKVKTTDPDDGPDIVIQASGLPAIGSFWNYGNGSDTWAFCWPTRTQKPMVDGEPNQFWLVESYFTTKPFQRCQTTTIEDPLLEPQKVSGSFVKYTKEAIVDRNGNPLVSSSNEMYRGPQVEIDGNRPTVTIEQNVLVLGLDVFAPMVDTVNDASLWGLPARTIKLSNVSWERKHHGVCNKYYTRIFQFDVNFNTYDRSIIDEGTKVHIGHWSKCSPGTGTGTGPGTWVVDGSSFQRFKDCNGENIRTLLDGAGNPLLGGVPVFNNFQFYSESNFLTLNVPLAL